MTSRSVIVRSKALLTAASLSMHVGCAKHGDTVSSAGAAADARPPASTSAAPSDSIPAPAKSIEEVQPTPSEMETAAASTIVDGRAFQLSVHASRPSMAPFRDMGGQEGSLRVEISIEAADRKALPETLRADRVWVRAIDERAKPIWQSPLTSEMSAGETSFGTAPHLRAVVMHGPPWSGRVDVLVRVRTDRLSFLLRSRVGIVAYE